MPNLSQFLLGKSANKASNNFRRRPANVGLAVSCCWRTMLELLQSNDYSLLKSTFDIEHRSISSLH